MPGRNARRLIFDMQVVHDALRGRLMGGNLKLGMQLRSAEIYAEAAERLLHGLGSQPTLDLELLRGADRLTRSVAHVAGNLTRGWQGLSTGAPLTYRLVHGAEIASLRGSALALAHRIDDMLMWHPADIAARGASLIEDAAQLHEQVLSMPAFRVHTSMTAAPSEAARAAAARAVSLVHLPQ